MIIQVQIGKRVSQQAKALFDELNQRDAPIEVPSDNEPAKELINTFFVMGQPSELDGAFEIGFERHFASPVSEGAVALFDQLKRSEKPLRVSSDDVHAQELIDTLRVIGFPSPTNGTLEIGFERHFAGR